MKKPLVWTREQVEDPIPGEVPTFYAIADEAGIYQYHGFMWWLTHEGKEVAKGFDGKTGAESHWQRSSAQRDARRKK